MTPEENAMRTNATRALYALLGVAVLASFLIWLTAHQQRVSDARWCTLMVSLDDRYQSLPVSPPPSAEALELAKAIHRLRSELHCPASHLQLDEVPAPSPS